MLRAEHLDVLEGCISNALEGCLSLEYAGYRVV